MPCDFSSIFVLVKQAFSISHVSVGRRQEQCFKPELLKPGPAASIGLNKNLWGLGSGICILTSSPDSYAH